MSVNIDYDALIRSAAAMLNNTSISQPLSNNEKSTVKIDYGIASHPEYSFDGNQKSNTSTTVTMTGVATPSTSTPSGTSDLSAKNIKESDFQLQVYQCSDYVGNEIWTPPPTTEYDSTFNGHFYHTHRPMAKTIAFYSNKTCFEYSDGHFYSTSWGTHAKETIFKNITAAPVLKLLSKLEENEMTNNFLGGPITEILKSKEFWHHARELTVVGNWHSSALKEIIGAIPKCLHRISMISFTAHGLPSFDIEDIMQNKKLNLQHLRFNCKATNFSEMYGNIELISKFSSDYIGILLLTTGMALDARRFEFMITKLTSLASIDGKSAFTVLTTEHVDDQIYDWLLRMGFQHVGKTKEEIPNAPSTYEYYETFNKNDQPFITLCFLSRD